MLDIWKMLFPCVDWTPTWSHLAPQSEHVCVSHLVYPLLSNWADCNQGIAQIVGPRFENCLAARNHTNRFCPLYFEIWLAVRSPKVDIRYLKVTISLRWLTPTWSQRAPKSEHVGVSHLVYPLLSNWADCNQGIAHIVGPRYENFLAVRTPKIRCCYQDFNVWLAVRVPKIDLRYLKDTIS